MTEREIEKHLSMAFGTTVHGWPRPMEREPRWWQFVCRRRERIIHQAIAAAGLPPITQADRDAFWRQARIGQGISEDAGGFVWRAWCALLRLPFEEPRVTYRGLIAREFGEQP